LIEEWGTGGIPVLANSGSCGEAGIAEVLGNGGLDLRQVQRRLRLGHRDELMARMMREDEANVSRIKTEARQSDLSQGRVRW
jgi:hypothetical protein